MKCKITTCASYDIQINNGKVFTGFRKGSSWNGMTEFIDQAGRKVIILDQPGMASFLDRMFGASTDSFEATVVLRDPSLDAPPVEVAA